MRTASLGLVLGYLLAFLAIGLPAAAQSTTGSIQGIVRDNQGGVIPGATVTLRNVETNATRSLATADDGSYRFLNMAIGNYELTAELSGFSRYVRSGLTLAVNQDAVVEVALRPRRSPRRSRCAPMRRSSTRRVPTSACVSTRPASPSCRSI
jgi:hypothetical protein